MIQLLPITNYPHVKLIQLLPPNPLTSAPKYAILKTKTKEGQVKVIDGQVICETQAERDEMARSEAWLESRRGTLDALNPDDEPDEPEVED